MAFLVYNGTNFDSIVDIRTITAAGSSLSTSYVAGAAITAPNTSNKLTGVLFYMNSLPSSGDVQIEIRESGVSKVSGIANLADLQLGYNYIRFTTPYQFTTTAAGAYVPYVKNTAASSGSVARESSTTSPLLIPTYDSGVNNKVAGLDVWDAGKISFIMVVFDYLFIFGWVCFAVWFDLDIYGAGEKGSVLDTNLDVAVSTRLADADYTAPTDPWVKVIESGYTAEELLRLITAVQVGKTTINVAGPNPIVTFRDTADTVDRVVATMDGSERSSVTLDGS